MMIFSGYVELLESICFEGQGVWTSSKKKTVGKSRIHQRDMWFLASQAVAASSSFNSRWRKVEDAAIKMMIGEGWGFILGLNFSPIISLEQLDKLGTIGTIGTLDCEKYWALIGYLLWAFNRLQPVQAGKVCLV